ncbi:MAG: hypothetical protein ABI540_07430 [Spartobacteria bacterium]
MPYTTELTEDYMGVLHSGTGVVTGEEILRGSQALAQLVENTENFHYEFVDLSAASDVQISPEHLRAIFEQDQFAAFFRPHEVVVIVAPNDRVMEVARQWEEMVQHLGWTIHIARERAAGWEWLRENFRTQPDENLLRHRDR